ncbi:hypothetical protein HCN44_000695 [Aphidius gifuensis]|uniref:PCI domain-containing protein n=2 Tax=Aphidius gifuensis TaxID=684658 RepID=A0A835CS47_APHGI|nr:leukocyte receptor cluster member 8 homolog isoform X2 [Aphidius gifuensis]XP_044011773.1 leukocyte receptor cluster member 8 homolog isoform X2 [Aphidius gifuensis]KAF7990890.1 hypothetical protein HCN44_000695 [Aphidius gifuensis]
MANMAWQYPQSGNMHMYSGFPANQQQMYGQGYNNPSAQMYYYHQGMMPGYGQQTSFNPQQVQSQNLQNNQVKQQQQPQQQQQQHIQGHQQMPPTPGQLQPMALDSDSELPPLPPGPPPPPPPPPSSTASSTSNQQQTNQNQMFMYNSFPYNGWNDTNNDMSQFNGQIRFNLPNKKAGLGFVPSGNSGAAKKKRKRNKNLAQQFHNSFQTNNTNTNNTTTTPPTPPTAVAAAGAVVADFTGSNNQNIKNNNELPPLPPAPPLPSKIDVPQKLINIPSIINSPSVDKMISSPIPLPSDNKISQQLIINQNQIKTTVGTTITNTNPVGDWPDSLKNYVHRCYEKCKTAVDKDQVEIILKGKITRSANDGSLWIKDWDKEPLPSIHSERMTMTIKSQQSPLLKQNNQLINIGQNNNIRKTGLSTSLGARLGARYAIGNNKLKSHSKSRSRSRSRSRSHSPPSRKYRRSASSSSSDTSDREHDYNNKNTTTPTSSKSKKSTRNNKTNHSSKKNNKKNKSTTKSSSSHFYSEFGNTTNEELGSKEKLQQRAARFHDTINKNSSINKDDNSTEFDFTGLHIVGTCKDLEKPYLRLTSAPAASAVRPVSVLQNSLVHVKNRWVNNQDYRYACDQLKSIRQDLTVQGIRDNFTVHVYETHARVALERGDHEEFNQCQTQLRMLYQDLGGDNRCEFVAYRILYYIFTKNTQDLTTIMATLNDDDKNDECVKHALKVRSAWWLGNYHVLFKLFKSAPRMAAFLMDWFISRERKIALKNMLKSYRQNLAVDFIIAELAFQTLDKYYEFVTEFGLIYSDKDRQFLDCKASSVSLGSW